ncbi:MAG: futalosine hydrolase [Planctomycetota bacterium]|jgi:futalosine hydrolase
MLVCVATELEGALLREAGVSVVVTGIGPVNAAHALTAALADPTPRKIVVCGVGGAYPGSGLAVLDVTCAETETYADLGAESPDGFLDMEALGFPVVNDHYNRLPLSLFPAEKRVPYVTTTTCTGTDATARKIVERTGGAVESMEGAAIVHVALKHGLEVGELRAVSNLVGDRDRKAWKVRDAAAQAQQALLDWIQTPC